MWNQECEGGEFLPVKEDRNASFLTPHP